jgi:hypothetical protein
LGPDNFKTPNKSKRTQTLKNTAGPPFISRSISLVVIKMTAIMNRNSRMCCLISLLLSLVLPLRVASANAAAAACFVTSKYHQTTASKSTQLLVSSGFSFQDGQQVLVSVQKPLGIVLEERQAREQHQEDSDEDDGSDAIAGTLIFVAEMDPAGSASRAGVMTGDVLLAVQNASVENRSLEYVMAFLAQAPRVVNLRFLRQTT